MAAVVDHVGKGGDAVSCVSVVTWMDMHGMAVCTCSAVGVGGCGY